MLKPEEIDNYFHTHIGFKKNALHLTLRHSRKVKLAKLLLPSIAAVLVVTLLAIPTLRKDAKDFALDFTINKGDIEKLNVEKTTVYITDKNNRVNNFIANQINETAAGSQLYNLNSPEAVMPLNNKEWISIKSPGGLYNQQTGILHLQNNVETFFSKGMNIHTSEAFFDFKKAKGYTYTPVKGDGFLGKIDSQGFEFSSETHILTFLGKTSIIIDEQNLQKD